MVTQYYCLLIFMLSGAIFVDLCSINWVKRSNKRKNSSTDQTTSSTTDSPTTSEHVPVVIRRKEMLVFPIKGYRLEECSYFEKSVASIMDCAHLCLRENGQCRSINIEKARSEGGFICHFNNSTRESHVQKFVKNAAYNYLEPKNAWVNGHPVSMEDINILRN